MIRFQVALEEPHRIYFAGEEIKGQVEVDLRESLPIQGEYEEKLWEKYNYTGTVIAESGSGAITWGKVFRFFLLRLFDCYNKSELFNHFSYIDPIIKKKKMKRLRTSKTVGKRKYWNVIYRSPEWQVYMKTNSIHDFISWKGKAVFSHKTSTF